MLAETATDTAVDAASMLPELRATMLIPPSVEDSKDRSAKASTVLAMLLSDSEMPSEAEPPVAPKDAATDTAITDEEMVEVSSALRLMSPSTRTPRSVVLAT